MTLDDLDIDPVMFETYELRTIFRLAKERISELRQLIAELESEAVEVLELHESTVAHVGRLETANTELATTNAHLASEVAALREAHHDH